MTSHFMQTMCVGIFRVPHQGFICIISEFQGSMFSMFEGNISCPRKLARKRSSRGLFFPPEERGCLPKVCWLTWRAPNFYRFWSGASGLLGQDMCSDTYWLSIGMVVVMHHVNFDVHEIFYVYRKNKKYLYLCIYCIGSSSCQGSQGCCLLHSESTDALEPSAVLSHAVL